MNYFLAKKYRFEPKLLLRRLINSERICYLTTEVHRAAWKDTIYSSCGSLFSALFSDSYCGKMLEKIKFMVSSIAVTVPVGFMFDYHHAIFPLGQSHSSK